MPAHTSRRNKSSPGLRMSEEALNESELHLRSLIEAIPDTVQFKDSDGRWLVANTPALKAFGLEEAEWQGRSDRELAAAFPALHEALESCARSDESVRQQGVPQSGEEVVRQPDGSVRIFDIIKVPMKDGTGTINGLVVLGHDITKRKQSEKALRLREQALSGFFSNAPIGLLWVDPDGRILQVNQALLKLLALPEASMRGHCISEFDAGEEISAIIPPLLQHGETIHDHRAQLLRKDGTVIQVLIDVTAVMEDGRLVRTDWFVRDISNRVRLEREILEVTERERQQVGRELHDDLGQILHGAHFLAAELQARMQKKGMVEAPELDRVTRFLDEALEVTRSLAHGLQPVAPVPEALVNALRELAARIRMVYGVSCRFICPRHIEVQDQKVATHLFRIAQEATNNAVRHAKCKRISIRLKAANGRLILGIRDDGRGRLPNSKSRGGIGLRVMQFRAAAINGSLVVQHTPHGGTEVVCTLDSSSIKPAAGEK